MVFSEEIIEKPPVHWVFGKDLEFWALSYEKGLEFCPLSFSKTHTKKACMIKKKVACLESDLGGVPDWLCRVDEAAPALADVLDDPESEGAVRRANYLSRVQDRTVALDGGPFHRHLLVVHSLVLQQQFHFTFTVSERVVWSMSTALIGRLRHCQNIDPFSIVNFVVFTIMNDIYYEARKNCFACLLFKKHMHADLNDIISCLILYWKLGS